MGYQRGHQPTVDLVVKAKTQVTPYDDRDICIFIYICIYVKRGRDRETERASEIERDSKGLRIPFPTCI